jgi:hypothetical protein
MEERHARLTRLIVDPDGSATDVALTGGSLHVERRSRDGTGALSWRIELMGLFPRDVAIGDAIQVEVWDDSGRHSRGNVLIRRQAIGTGPAYVSLTGDGPLERA